MLIVLIGEIFISASILISAFILIVLLRMRNKDISIQLRTQLIFYDIIMEIVNVFAFYLVSQSDTISNPTWYTALVMSSLLYTRFLHTLLILTIAWCLFSIIVRQDFSVERKINQYTIRTNILTVLVVIVYNFICFFSTDRSEISYIIVENMIYFYPSPFVLGFLIFYYIKVRKTLKNELESQTQRSCCKRIFAKHLIGYPINYSIIAFLSILIAAYSVNEKKFDFKILFTIGNFMFYVFYPIMNSVLYGITKSTKKFMCAFLLRDKNYEEEEEILRMLRDSQLLREQYYLDLISRTEEFDYVNDNATY